MSDLRGMLKRSVHVWCGSPSGCRNEDDMPTVEQLRRLGWRKLPATGWICPDCSVNESGKASGDETD